jgi:hypothetical protein
MSRPLRLKLEAISVSLPMVPNRILGGTRGNVHRA